MAYIDWNNASGVRVKKMDVQHKNARFSTSGFP